MSEHTFEDIYKSVQNLEAGSFVTFNGFPMVVETHTTTYNRYYGELRWVNQLDGKLQIDVTVRVGINFESEVTRLKAEVERLKFTLEEERQIMREDWAGLRCEKDKVQRALEYAEAQVERLTNAGDLMCRMAGNNQVINRHWKTAKKGVQS